MTGFRALLARDLLLARRQGGEVWLALLFFLFGTVLFPLGIGPEANRLASVAGGVLWVMALLATLLALDRLFQEDMADGSLDLIVAAPGSMGLVVLAKCLAHWLLVGLPLVIAAPLLAVLLSLPAAGMGALVAALALGTPTLSLIGAVGAGITLGARRGGVLLTLIVLPLYIPVLIFGAGAVEAAVTGGEIGGHLMVLAAFLLAALALAPWAAASACRLALE
jgi:heme exporter protein B